MRIIGRSLPRAAAMAALLACTVPAGAQEWTRFRGPHGTGIGDAEGLPVTITTADYNWRVALPGAGASSPVLWGRRIFITSAEEERGKRYLLCLDAASGRTLWTRAYDFTRHPKHQFNGYASATPAVDADHVYVLWMEPARVSIHALDHAGREVWKRELGSYHAPHGAGASPIVVGDTVIVSIDQEHRGATPAGGAKPESALIGLDRKTGAVRWKHVYETGPMAGYATPAVLVPEGGPPEVIASSRAHGITSLDPRTGEVNWKASGVLKQRCVASPLVAHGLVFQTAGTGGGEKELVVVRPGSKQHARPATVAYQIPRDISYVPTPVAHGDLVFFWGDGGIVTCVKAVTGEVVARARVGGTFFGSPVCIRGRLYAINAAGDLVVVEASEKMTLLGRSPLGEESQATPAVAGGVMYLRTASHLISVGGRGRRVGVNG